MSKSFHKGTELNNVKETWEQNERARSNNPRDNSKSSDDQLERVIHEEAAEYDNTNKQEQLLDGERASISDEKEE